MLLNFEDIKEVIISHLNNGDSKVSARMSVQNNGKIMLSRISTGSSIGLHKHSTSDDISYVIAGIGKAICDDKEEILVAGSCHYCPKGSSHSIINTGIDDLVLFTTVPEL